MRLTIDFSMLMCSGFSLRLFSDVCLVVTLTWGTLLDAEVVVAVGALAFMRGLTSASGTGGGRRGSDGRDDVRAGG